MDFSFADKLAESKAAEAIAKQFLLLQPGIVRVEDVREVKDWQRRDVDYRVHLKAGGVVNVEVKHDRHITTTGSVLFEVCHLRYDSRRVSAGWSIFSQAQSLLIYCPPSGLLYTFRANDLRDGMLRYTRHQRGNVRASVVTSNNNTWSTFNLLVPLRFVQHKKYIRMGSGWLAVN